MRRTDDAVRSRSMVLSNEKLKSLDLWRKLWQKGRADELGSRIRKGTREEE